jgi:hypothetical protein
MSDWLDRCVEAASLDLELVRELERVHELELEAILPGGLEFGGFRAEILLQRAQEVLLQRAQKETREQQEYDLILDRIAARLAEPGENPAELAQWLSYHYGEVLERVRHAR